MCQLWPVYVGFLENYGQRSWEAQPGLMKKKVQWSLSDIRRGQDSIVVNSMGVIVRERDTSSSSVSALSLAGRPWASYPVTFRLVSHHYNAERLWHLLHRLIMKISWDHSCQALSNVSGTENLINISYYYHEYDRPRTGMRQLVSSTSAIPGSDLCEPLERLVRKITFKGTWEVFGASLFPGY